MPVQSLAHARVLGSDETNARMRYTPRLFLFFYLFGHANSQEGVRRRRRVFGAASGASGGSAVDL